jgi:D-glycero-D-manno-heptose 1,7-bisphosphate phosphatase
MFAHSTTKKIIILDRDGVINQDSDGYIKCVDEWIPIPGSLQAIAGLCHANYKIVVASNQSGIGRGYFTIHSVNAIHRKMRRELASLGAYIDAVFFCPHSPREACRCRKPMTGLFQDISERLATSLHGVPFIGDSLSDMQAAKRIGAFPVLVLTGKGRRTLYELTGSLCDVPVYPDLARACEGVLSGFWRQP